MTSTWRLCRAHTTNSLRNLSGTDVLLDGIFIIFRNSILLQILRIDDIPDQRLRIFFLPAQYPLLLLQPAIRKLKQKGKTDLKKVQTYLNNACVTFFILCIFPFMQLFFCDARHFWYVNRTLNQAHQFINLLLNSDVSIFV